MLNKKALAHNDSDSLSIDHQRLAALLNSMSDGVIALSASGEIVMSNSAMLSLLDLNSTADKQIEDILDIIDKAGNKLSISKILTESSSGFSSRDFRLKYPDGSTINIFLSLSPVIASYGGNEGGGFVIVVRDITREKLVEDERDEFVSVAGHELRTPVTIAEGSLSNAEYIAKQNEVPASVLQSIQTAHKQVVFLSEMINDLAMLTRADRTNLKLDAETFDAVELAKDLAASFQTQATAKNIELKVESAQDQVNLTSNALYVREIIQNFVTNAIKYTETGGITIAVNSMSDGAVYKISDTGIGISQAEQKKLFTKFFRSEDTRVKKVHGTGLGLYLCFKLAKLLGAKISIESVLNEGSTVTFEVPNCRTSSSISVKSQ